LHRIIECDQVLGIMVLCIQSLHPVDEDLMLMLSEQLDERLSSIPIDLTFESDVVGHLWQALLVEVNEVIK
jgi:hypothetical protein